MLEAYSTLAAIAARTKTVRLGTLVTGVTYRNPAILAKTVTTLDVISGGRAILGHRRGLERGRARRLRRRLPADRRADGPPRRGAHDRPGDVHRGPAELQRPVLPDRPGPQRRRGRSSPAARRILVGGGGEQRTLKIAAAARRHDPLVPARPRDAAPQDRGPGAPLRGDRPRPGDHRADDGHARAPGRERPGGEEGPGDAALRSAAPTSRRARRSRRPRACDPISRRASRGFTFNDTVLPTAESIALAGELLRLIR